MTRRKKLSITGITGVFDNNKSISPPVFRDVLDGPRELASSAARGTSSVHPACGHLLRCCRPQGDPLQEYSLRGGDAHAQHDSQRSAYHPLVTVCSGGKIQTRQRFKSTLFIRTKHNLHIFRVIPFSFIKLQNDT